MMQLKVFNISLNIIKTPKLVIHGTIDLTVYISCGHDGSLVSVFPFCLLYDKIILSSNVVQCLLLETFTLRSHSKKTKIFQKALPGDKNLCMGREHKKNLNENFMNRNIFSVVTLNTCLGKD